MQRRVIGKPVRFAINIAKSSIDYVTIPDRVKTIDLSKTLLGLHRARIDATIVIIRYRVQRMIRHCGFRSCVGCR